MKRGITILLVLLCVFHRTGRAQQGDTGSPGTDRADDGLAFIEMAEPVTFEVSGMELTEIFKSLAGKININIVCSAKVKGKATLRLDNVDPATALRRVAEMNALGIFTENDVVNIVTEDEFRERWGRGPRDVTKVWRLKHVDPSKVLAALQGFKTKKGNLSVDPRTGSVILVDTPEVVAYVDGLIRDLDVEVVTRAYQVEHSDAAALVKTIREAMTPAGTLVTDTRTNSILVTDTAASHGRIEAFCKALDVPVKTEVFHLQHVLPADAETKLKAVLPKDTNLQVDKDNCNVIVVADEPVLKIVRDVIQAIDAPPAVMTKEFRIQYGDGETIEKNLKECVTKELGDVHFDKFSRTLTVKDLPGRVDTIAGMIHAWDRRNRQVRIEVKICEVTLSDGADYGIDWNLVLTLTGVPEPTTYSLKPFFQTVTPNTIKTFLVSNSQFSGVMDFLQTKGTVDVVSAPNVTVVEGYDAEIYVGTTVPIALYEHSKETGVLILSGYEEKDIGVVLNVTPFVDTGGWVTMDVNAEASEIIDWKGQFNERPVTSTRKVTTELRLKNNDWVILGGLMRTFDRENKQGVPLLSMIPIIGIPFRRTIVDRQKGELAIFLCPTIVDDTESSRMSVGKQSLRVPLQHVKGVYRQPPPVPEKAEMKSKRKKR